MKSDITVPFPMYVRVFLIDDTVTAQYKFNYCYRKINLAYRSFASR